MSSCPPFANNKEAITTLFIEIDRLNDADPNRININGEDRGACWIYGRRMSERLNSFCSDASLPLQVAARAQHIERWAIARNTLPMNRQGYHQWRRAVAGHHAKVASKLLQKHGYDQGFIAQVAALLQKQNLHKDPSTQILEDVACLVFIEHHLHDFSHKHPREKLINIISRTWGKMSPAAHTQALKLPLSDELKALIELALAN